VVGHHAVEKTWNKLHELGLKTTSIEDKQNYYNALACATDPKLVKKTLAIALTDELPTSRAHSWFHESPATAAIPILLGSSRKQI
jgi:hypothetical protein